MQWKEHVKEDDHAKEWGVEVEEVLNIMGIK